MNVCTFTGRLAADAELRQAGSTPVANFRLAVDTSYGANKSTLWLACSLFGVRAEKVAPMLRKGGKIAVSGALSTEEFTGRDGQRGMSIKLKVQDLELLDRKGDEAATAPARKLEDEIPF